MVHADATQRREGGREGGEKIYHSRFVVDIHLHISTHFCSCSWLLPSPILSSVLILSWFEDRGPSKGKTKKKDGPLGTKHGLTIDPWSLGQGIIGMDGTLPPGQEGEKKGKKKGRNNEPSNQSGVLWKARGPKIMFAPGLTEMNWTEWLLLCVQLKREFVCPIETTFSSVQWIEIQEPKTGKKNSVQPLHRSQNWAERERGRESRTKRKKRRARPRSKIYFWTGERPRIEFCSYKCICKCKCNVHGLCILIGARVDSPQEEEKTSLA